MRFISRSGLAALAAVAGVLVLFSSAAELTRRDEAFGLRRLFNGESLRGWEAPGNNWVARDGEIQRASPGGDLYYRMYTLSDNFELEFEWNVSPGGASGAAYRPAQLQYLVLDPEARRGGETSRARAGSIAGFAAATRDAAHPAGEWNQSRIVCRGTQIEHWLNGEKVVDLDYTQPSWSEAAARLKRHGADLEARGGFLRFLDRGAFVAYRNISMRQLPPDGLPQLYQENLLDTMSIRTKLWKQMTVYADSLLEVEKEPIQPYESLAQRYRYHLGFPPPEVLENQELRMDKTGEDDLAIYYRCRVKVTPELDAYGLFLVPKKAQFPAPLVLSLHGNAGYPEAALFHGGGNYFDMVRGPLSRGYVVYAPQMVVHAPRDAKYGSPIPQDVLRQLDSKFRKAGTSLTAVEAARILKALDAVLKRPEVDPNRVGMVGLSYGGFMTLRTAALDSRIKAAVVSCGYFSRRSFLAEEISLPQLPALVAPRALQVQSGIHDPLLPIEIVRTYEEESKSAYGAKGTFEMVEFNGGHEFNGELAWKFLADHL